MLLTNLARNYRNLNPEQYNCEMNGGSKSNQFTCHLAVPSAVCSSRRSSAAVGPPPVTPAASGSPPLLSCTHILYTDSILRRHQKPRGIHQHQIRENATQPGEISTAEPAITDHETRGPRNGGKKRRRTGRRIPGPPPRRGRRGPSPSGRTTSPYPLAGSEPRASLDSSRERKRGIGFRISNWWVGGAVGERREPGSLYFSARFCSPLFPSWCPAGGCAYYCVALRRGPWAGGRRARGNAAAALALPCWERGYSAAVWDATHDCYHQIIRLRLYCQAVAIGNACVFCLVLKLFEAGIAAA